MDQTRLEDNELRQYLNILRTRKWTIAVAVAVSLVVALGWSARQTPLYSAESRLIVQQYSPAGYFPKAENEAEKLQSVQVADLVRRELATDVSIDGLLGGLDAEPLSPTGDVVVLTYTSPDPVFARDAVNSFARNYLQHQADEIREGLTASEQAIENQIANVKQRIQEVAEDLELARRSGNADDVAELDTERSTLISRLSVLESQLSDIRSGSPGEVIVGTIIKPATVPASPSSPNHIRNGILGMFVGLLIGIGLAFVRERLDDRFRGRPDVETAIQAPVLATVPKFGGRHDAEHELPVATDPRGPASEAYRNLRTGLQFISSQRGAKTFLITSPSAHEGKTSTVSNLGVALSQSGRSVILVSCDLRRPQLEKALGAETNVGLSTWLLGDVSSLDEILLQHPSIPHLHLLPAGQIPSNPAELLTSPRIPELIQGLRDVFDYVIIDSPPVLPVADAVILASQVDAVILVVDAANTRRSAAVHAKEQIERVGGIIVGCVLNAFDPTSTPYYYEPYYYSTYYASAVDEDEPTSFANPSPVVDLHRGSRSQK